MQVQLKSKHCILLLFVGLLFGHANAQSGTAPMSVFQNERYSKALHELNSTVHTAIKPYRYKDVRGIDTLNAKYSFLRFQIPDTVLPGYKKVRVTPLLDALVGFDVAQEDAITYSGGAGFLAEMDLGPHWTVSLNGQYWVANLPSFLDSVAIATQNVMGNGYATESGGNFTHYDVGGYVNYSPNKFFDFQLGRGKHFFGEGYRSLFLSNTAYSMPYLKVSTNVWRVRYINLFTQLSDIRGASGQPSDFAKKYASMHYLSWNISKRVNFSVFESIIWQSNDEQYRRGFDINYLNPVIFYRPVEFGIGSPDNALLGFSFNVKVAKKGLLYSQLMFDEFLLAELRNREGWFGNKQAFQLGVLWHDVLSTPGLNVRSELNYVRPFIYTHSDSRQNYSHHGEPLAHPHGSNFWEWVNKADYRKGRLTFSNTLALSVLGVDTGIYSYGNNIFRPESDRPVQSNGVTPENRGFYLLEPSRITVLQNELKASYLLAPVSGISIQAGYVFRSMTGESIPNQNNNWFNIGVSSNFRERDTFRIPRYTLP